MSNWWYGDYCYLFTIALMYNYIIIFRCNQSFLIDGYVFGTMPDFALISVGISLFKFQNKIQTITDKGQSLKLYCKDLYCIDQWKKNPDRPIVKIFRKYVIIFQPSLLTVWKFMVFCIQVNSMNYNCKDK